MAGQAREERVRAAVAADPAPRASAGVCGTREAGRAAVAASAPEVRPAAAEQEVVGVAAPVAQEVLGAEADMGLEAQAVRAAVLVQVEVPEPAVPVERGAAQVLVAAVEAGLAGELALESAPEPAAEREAAAAALTLLVVRAALEQGAESAEAQVRAEQVPVAGRVRAV